MAVKTDRIEARLSPEQRALIDRAAAMTEMSSSAFVVNAAVDRADRVLAEAMVTMVPTDYFDRLVAALDEPDAVPRLAKAAARTRRGGRIAPQ